MPIDTRPAQMLLRSLGNLRAKLDHPQIHGRQVNSDPAFYEQVHHVLIGQRVTQILTDSTQNDLTRKAMVFER